MNRKNQGFALVELVVVIVVITVIATAAFLVSYRKTDIAADTDRDSDIAAIARDLERFYLRSPSDAQPSYPSTQYINNNSNQEQTFSLYSSGQLTAVNSPSKSFIVATSNSSSQNPTPFQYIYQPLRADGSLCTTAITSATSQNNLCARYILYYKHISDQSTVLTRQGVHQQ